MDIEDLTSYLSGPSHRHLPHHFRIIIIAAVIGLGVPTALIFSFFHTHTVDAEVTGFSWQSTIVQQEFGWQTHQDWDIPAGGIETGRSWEYHYTIPNSIKVGKTTIDNSIRVFDWYYTYKIQEWFNLQTLKAAGTDKNPGWPDIVTDSTHRGVDYHQTFWVTFRTSTKDYQHSLSENEWNQLTFGQFVSLSINHYGMIMSYKIEN